MWGNRRAPGTAVWDIWGPAGSVCGWQTGAEWGLAWPSEQGPILNQQSPICPAVGRGPQVSTVPSSACFGVQCHMCSSSQYPNEPCPCSRASRPFRLPAEDQGMPQARIVRLSSGACLTRVQWLHGLLRLPGAQAGFFLWEVVTGLLPASRNV